MILSSLSFSEMGVMFRPQNESSSRISISSCGAFAAQRELTELRGHNRESSREAHA